ncbi:MAG TPA: alpha/beta hydrolase [Moraxellaceae bacterium]|nr:alpha/beta hydrolase [Moraxellaceae bacterium]
MSRTTWVFLRGIIRQHRHWEDFPARFLDAFPDAQLILPDFPGNGDLHDHESPTSITEMVEFLRNDLQGRGLQGPVRLLAVSLGAMVGIEWLRRHPEEVERAVLINTSMPGLSRITERLRREAWPDILKSLLFISHEERERMFVELTSNLYPNKDALAKRWAGYAHAQPTTRMNALRQLFAATTWRPPESRPHEHVLLLQSLGDHVSDPVCTTRIADCWRWPLVSHPTAGHDLTLDDPEWVVAQVQHWLATGDGAA